MQQNQAHGSWMVLQTTFYLKYYYMKIHRFKTLYPVSVYVYFGEDLSPVVDDFVYVDEREGSIQSSYDNNDALCYYECKRKDDDSHAIILCFKDYDVLTIVHEAVHCARHIWEHVGESVTGVEADAYLMEWVVRCCIEAYEENEGITDKILRTHP